MAVAIAKIIRSRRKTIALVILADGSLVVRAPLRATKRQIEELVEQKERWIRAKQDFARSAPRIQPKTFSQGEQFMYLGKLYPLHIRDITRKDLVLEDRFILPGNALPQAAILFSNWYRRQALMVISNRVELYARQIGLTYQQVRISSARTRWGSCSSSGKLSFTWRLVMAPIEVIDYVVVHELVHTLEHNHSRAFWIKVERIMPDYRQKMEWLKANGDRLRL